MDQTATPEEFAPGSSYREADQKCFSCGRLIPHEPQYKRLLGEARMFCSEDCIQVFEKYRLPYIAVPIEEG